MKQPKTYQPERCWVGNEQKICYETLEEAEGAARLVEAEHNLKSNSLYAYACEYGKHWHLATK